MQTSNATQEWLCYCRAGFESEVAQELQCWVEGHGGSGYARAERDSGYVRYTAMAGDGALAMPPSSDLIFARQCLTLVAELRALPKTDRLTPILAALPDGMAVADVWVEAPDSVAGEELMALCRGIETVAVAALKRSGRMQRSASQRLHVCFIDGDHAFVALGSVAHSAPWRQGIIRLKFPKGGPSRSTLKLDEAFQVLLSEAERERWLRADMRAVDLGAAPGGWTFQLVRRGMRVIAVDNGPMDAALLSTGQVEHLRADGFRYRPAGPVDWLVCDMVEQPARVAALMAEWLSLSLCRAACFNLKLPMKKRWQETQSCLDAVAQQVSDSGRHIQLRAKQLYHDREEITVIALPA